MISPIDDFDSYFWGLIFPALFSSIETSPLKSGFIEMITADEDSSFEVIGNLLEFIETGDADLLQRNSTWENIADRISADETRFFWSCYSLVSGIIKADVFNARMSELHIKNVFTNPLEVKILDASYHIAHDIEDGLSNNYEDDELVELVRRYVFLDKKGSESV